MIIDLRIELKNDGTWELVESPKPKPHQPRSMLKHFDRVDEHFKNRDRVRKKRAREKSRNCHHCSECGLAHRNKVTHPGHMIELADRA